MKNLILILSLLCTHSYGLEIHVGESRRIPVLSDSKIHVGSKKHLAVIDQDSHILLIGKSPGDTLLTLNGKSFMVRVLEKGQSEFFKELESLFKKRMGLKAEWIKSQLHVTGDIYVFKDWLEISKISRKWNAAYSFAARPSAEVRKDAESYFKKQLGAIGVQNFQMNGTLPLKMHLQTENKTVFEEASRFMSGFGVLPEKSSSLIHIKPLIKTSVILAEVSKNVSQSFGLQFPSEEQAQLLPSLQGPEQLLISIKALESRGLGRVLATPTLNCRSEAEAEFHAGGEFPIRINGFRGSQRGVEWKKHGVVLKVKPKADSSGAIQLSIESEISLIDSSQLVDGLPALKINRVRSHFDLREKNTVALSGLIQETWSRGQSGLLGLSKIPVLGALFRSDEFLNHQSELVIFVTPEIVDTSEKTSIVWPGEWSRNDL